MTVPAQIAPNPRHAVKAATKLLIRRGVGDELLVEGMAARLAQKACAGQVPVYFTDEKDFGMLLVPTEAAKWNSQECRPAHIILIGSNIARILNPAEMNGVIAHEIAHLKNGDTIITPKEFCALERRINSIHLASGFGMVTGFSAVLLSISGVMGALETSIGTFAAGTILIGSILGIGMAAAILNHKAWDLAAKLVRSLANRPKEFLADKMAGELTGEPEALVSALTKLYGARHKLFSNPLLSDHPSTKRRVKRLLAQAEEMKRAALEPVGSQQAL